MRYAELAARGAGASARLVPRRRRLSAPGAAHNWCENIKFSLKHWATPETLQELQAAVVAAASVRVLGSGHSFSAVCDSEDTLVSLAFMRDVLGVTVVDEDAMFVSVEGGAPLGDVVRHLAPRGFALKNIPSLPHVTVAGALATATHGTGLRPGLEGGMPSACREIEFVTADGSLARYARGDAAFGASVVHLGALGVVSRVALDVVPSYGVGQRVYEEVDLDLFLPRFEEVARGVDSLTVGINFGQQAALLWMRYFDRPDGRGTPPPRRNFKQLHDARLTGVDTTRRASSRYSSKHTGEVCAAACLCARNAGVSGARQSCKQPPGLGSPDQRSCGSGAPRLRYSAWLAGACAAWRGSTKRRFSSSRIIALRPP